MDLELPWYHRCLHHIPNEFYRIEKYRPEVLDDVVGNDEIVSRLKAIAKTGNMPHILLSVYPIFWFVYLVHERRI